MDVVVFAIALLASAAFVAAPLYRQAKPPVRAMGQPMPDSAEVALSDLEVDRASGLVDDASYADERAILEAQIGRTRPPAD